MGCCGSKQKEEEAPAPNPAPRILVTTPRPDNYPQKNVAWRRSSSLAQPDWIAIEALGIPPCGVPIRRKKVGVIQPSRVREVEQSSEASARPKVSQQGPRRVQRWSEADARPRVVRPARNRGWLSSSEMRGQLRAATPTVMEMLPKHPLKMTEEEMRAFCHAHSVHPTRPPWMTWSERDAHDHVRMWWDQEYVPGPEPEPEPSPPPSWALGMSV